MKFSSLEQELFDGAGVTKGDLIGYLEAIADRFVPVLAGRALSLIRVRQGQEPFMQKNASKYTPEWITTVRIQARSSRRETNYVVCDDRDTLLWLGNQRAVEYHPQLFTGTDWAHPTHLVMDLDPPEGGGFSHAAAAAHLVRSVLTDVGLSGAVKTSGAKGCHVFVPVTGDHGPEDVAAATRAIAARAERLDPELATTAFIIADRGGKVFLDATRSGGATVAAAYSPRARPDVPVSFPVPWDELDGTVPAEITIRTALGRLGESDPWHDLMPEPQRIDHGLVEEGHTIPVARVQAMHEGKRRKREARG
jgi:bifunctional non-homologous end joining protein LigD